MAQLIVTLSCLIFYLVLPVVLGDIRPGCLHSDGQLVDLTGFPVGGTPMSWVMSPGSSLFGTPDYLPITVPPYCETTNFQVPTYQQHLNTTTFGGHLLVTEVVSSTQELAKDYVGLSSGFVVIADKQKKGKGRGGSSWSSPFGDIFMSVNVNLTDRSLAPFLQSIAALSVVNAVHEKRSGYEKIDLTYVWPHTVAWNNRQLKLAGAIAEQSPIDDSWYTIGIGVRLGSVSGHPTLNSIIATHNLIHGTKLEPIGREEMAARVLNNLEALTEMLRKNPQLILDLLTTDLITRKKTVHLSFTGIVSGINSNNELIVKDTSGLKVLINPDLHIVKSDDTIVSSPILY